MAWIVLSAAVAGQQGAAATVIQDGARRELASLGMSGKDEATVADWVRWAEPLGYAVALDQACRVILVHPKSQSKQEDHPAPPGDAKRPTRVKQSTNSILDEIDLVDQTVAYWDDLVGAPTTAGEMPVLAFLEERDWGALMTRIAALRPYLKDWAARSRSLAGIVLQEPLVGAWLASGTGLEEFNPRNELVNRLTRLLLMRRYGLLPEWLDQGFAWHTEEHFLETFYCFPWRDGFVFCRAHAGWAKDVRGYLKKEFGKQAVTLADIAFPRETPFDEWKARLCWGAASYLVAEQADHLDAFLTALAAYRDAHNRRDLGDGNWEQIIDYEVPVPVQEEQFVAHFGADAPAAMDAWLRSGRFAP